ncbi:MAG TPA: outer membrane protein assembly factor BamA [Haliangiales bacterium]|nr:outer membrane protein assembly factor BamA [Haliangiales bacterium]
MKWLRCRCWLLLGMLAPGWPLSLAAQTGLVIEKIEIKHVGPPAVSDDLVRANIHVKVGDTYNPNATTDDIRTLNATGYFYQIRVALERTDGGVKLVYVVQGQPVLSDVRFEGNRKYSNTKLLKKVKSRIGESLDDYKLFTDAQEIKKMYEKAGYQQTKVEATKSINEQLGRATVTFEIKEAPKVRIVDVQFVGAQAFSQRKLRKQLKTRRRWMFSWLTGSGKLKEEQFQEDQEKLKDFYWNEGYVDFEIKEAKLDRISPTRMVIRFIVYEGRRYKVGSVEFKGNVKFTAEQVRQGVVVLGHPVRPRMLEGQIFTPKGLEKDREAIEDFYGAHGHIGKEDLDHVRVGITKNANTDRGTMDLVYQIEEGEPSKIEKIEIHGNTKTKDKVIRRELAVAPGELFDMVRVKLSKERLEGLQYFTKVQTEVEPTEVPNLKNLIVDVEEGPSGNFYFGAGFSSIDQLFGYVGMTQGNFDLFNPPYFTGGGQKLRLQATIGTKQENYELTFVEPWFLNRKLALEVDLFHRDIQYYSDLYDQRETGARLSLTRALFTDAFRVGLSYTIENVGIRFGAGTTTNVVVTQGPWNFPTRTIIPPSVSPTLLQEQGDRLVSKAGVSLTYDTRGGGLLPNRGQRTSLGVSVAGGPLGGDTDFYKLELESKWYFRGPFEGHVLELGATAGVVERFGDSTRVPLFDRFFLGGATTMRGYKFRHVGPKDEFAEPIGGGTYWFGTAEYSVPIIERLRFAAFYDIGMVYQNAYSLDPNGFNTGTYNDDWGIGIRLNIPQLGPLRLDYAFPITHGPDTSGAGRFQFSVGYERPF